MTCQIQEQPREDVSQALERIEQLTNQQIEALRLRDDHLLVTIDTELEAVFGEKERRFGALFEHRRKHGW